MRPLSHYFHALSFAPCLPIPCALLELTNHYYVYRNKRAPATRLGGGIAEGAINSSGPHISHAPIPKHYRTPQEERKLKGWRVDDARKPIIDRLLISAAWAGVGI